MWFSSEGYQKSGEGCYSHDTDQYLTSLSAEKSAELLGYQGDTFSNKGKHNLHCYFLLEYTLNRACHACASNPRKGADYTSERLCPKHAAILKTWRRTSMTYTFTMCSCTPLELGSSGLTTPGKSVAWKSQRINKVFQMTHNLSSSSSPSHYPGYVFIKKLESPTPSGKKWQIHAILLVAS